MTGWTDAGVAFRHRFTVYTPCFNSAATLHRVWDSLRVQTYHDFEWLVVDDGSTDRTLEVLQAYRAEARFPVRVIRLDQNRGHAASLNLAVAAAGGMFFLKTDSDDTFPPNALQVLHDWWEAIPLPERDGFAGVTGCCLDESGDRLEPPFPRSPFDVTANELYFVHGFRREKWGFTRTCLMRQTSLPEVDRYVPESVVWRRIAATRRTRFVNDAVRVYHRTPGSLSQSRTIRYPRGQAYAIALETNLAWRYWRHDPVRFLHHLLLYGVFSRLAGLRMRQAMAHLQPPLARGVLVATAPIWILGARGNRGRLDPEARTGDWR